MRRAAAAIAFVCLATSATAKDVRAIVRNTAQKHGVPVQLATGVAHTESRFRCNVTGGVGEKGAMQVRPATARMVGVRGNLYHCETGIEAGMRYLKRALEVARGDWGIAARLYNAGLGASRILSDYSRKVLKAAQ
jgi:soluble lytic murein transglycosylase-like protein